MWTNIRRLQYRHIDMSDAFFQMLIDRIKEMAVITKAEVSVFDANGMLLCHEKVNHESNIYNAQIDPAKQRYEVQKILHELVRNKTDKPLFYFCRANTIRMSAPVFVEERFVGAIILGELPLEKYDDKTLDINSNVLALLGECYSQYIFYRNIRMLSDRYQQELEHKEKQLEKIKEELTLNLLMERKTKVNSAFINKVLESVIMSTKAEGLSETSDSLDCLNRFLLRSPDESGTVSSLEEEIQYVKNYLAIDRLAFGSRLIYTINVDEETANAVLPAFTIHPFVERAVINGLSVKKGQGHLYLNVRRDRSLLRIDITDDGVGITPEKLAELKSRDPKYYKDSKIDLRNHTSIGSRNALIILYKQFGDQFEWDIESEIGKGTKVRLAIPYISGRTDTAALPNIYQEKEAGSLIN